MRRMKHTCRLGLAFWYVLLFSATVSCAASGTGKRYAEWVDKSEFGGATDYWLQKTEEIQIPDAGTVPFPKYPGSKVIDFQDNRESGEVFNRMVLVTTEPFQKVQEWYKGKVPTYCAYEKQEKPVLKYVLARKCDSNSREAGGYDLFTTNPNITVKEIGSHLRDFYGNFLTIIEIAYHPDG